MRSLILLAVVGLVVPSPATERAFRFDDSGLDRLPPGFHSSVAGRGKPGEWKIVLDDAPPALAPLSSNAPAISKREVLAQLARDPTENHFPMLIFDGESFSDFTLTTRFKTVEGTAAQIAGILFRFQDEKNFYALYASSLDNRFRFYKVANGVLGTQYGPQVPIPRGEWHEMTVRCEGNVIHCLLDGKEQIPPITDNSFAGGKVGFWTKSDSVSYFADAKITYRPREILAQTLVRTAVQENSRVLGLKIFALRPGETEVRVIASKDDKDLGQPGGKTEKDVISSGTAYFGREKGSVSVALPLRDRNGETIAAVRVTMKAFPGEIQAAAVARARPIVRRMQERVQALEDLFQ